MDIKDVKIGMEIVRTTSDYMQGNIGIVTKIIDDKTVEVKWNGCGGNKIKIKSIEPTSIPYTFLGEFLIDKKTGKYHYPKYIKI